MNDRLAQAEEVREALDAGRPVVALETSVLAQGLPAPRNRQAAAEMESAVREAGAVPAWVWVGGGALRIGASASELDALAEDEHAAKVGRGDLPFAAAGGGVGATTVSATIWAAHRVGIEVSATGGIGGVHAGGEDVSADLMELSRTPGGLVCSGPKSIMDPRATLERLEALGVAILGFRCDRLPFFVAREAPLPLEHRVGEPEEAAAVLRARRELATPSTVLVCSPVPREAALPADEVAAAVEECRREGARRGVEGKDVTPFLLRCLAERTGGASLDANLALLRSNARLAGEIASALA